MVTGVSGAGRSTALHVLEDLGFFCVDNLPLRLATELVQLAAKDGAQDGSQHQRIGLGVDVRNGSFLEGADEVLDALTEQGHKVELLFLDCADGTLIRRYSESRRPHPLAPLGDVPAGIAEERKRLAFLRPRASHVIDTTRLSVHDLKRHIIDYLSRGTDRRQMVTRLVSFGFKYGLPVDADLVFDLRFIPNPHFVEALRPKTGLDKPVSDYVLQTTEAIELLADLEPLLQHVLPRYEKEGKAYLTIAIGCTGGRHRSVAMTEELAQRLRPTHEVHVSHRDVARKTPGAGRS